MQVCGLVVVLQVCMCRSAEFVDKVDESSKCVRRGRKEIRAEETNIYHQMGAKNHEGFQQIQQVGGPVRGENLLCLVSTCIRVHEPC